MGLYYGEELTTPRLICFGCIWAAVLLFSTDAVRNSRRQVVAPAA
jgi:EamA domain-containing membrane protein RarD